MKQMSEEQITKLENVQTKAIMALIIMAALLAGMDMVHGSGDIPGVIGGSIVVSKPIKLLDNPTDLARGTYSKAYVECEHYDFMKYNKCTIESRLNDKHWLYYVSVMQPRD